MTRLALNGLWARKRRLAGTFSAIFIGVAFLAGTLMLGDTLERNFTRLFTDVTSGTDAVVRSSNEVGSGGDAQRGMLPASLLQRVRQAPGVRAAAAQIDGYGALIGRNGDAVGGNGPPRLAGNWIANPDLNPYRIAEGRVPRADDEVVVNRGAMKRGHLKLGDLVTLQTPQPVRVRIVGVATFGEEDGLGGVTFTAFTDAGAERNVTKQAGRISDVLVQAAPGVSQEQLVSSIRPLLSGTGAEAITGKQLTDEQIGDINGDFLDMLRMLLVVFAGIALLVATFSIHNTFSIVVAQRTRESALLRAVGATRRQVLAAAVLETLLVGVAASLAGLVGGVAIASGLKAAFDAAGFALPAGGLTVTASSALIAVAVGIVVTLVAGLAPAFAASRVRPLAALRDVAVDRSDASRGRLAAGALLTAVGIVLAAAGVASGGIALAGLGALLTIVGVVVLGPALARPATALLGGPLPRLRGTVGALAQRNAQRNPRRTAGAAAALMVGVAVVTLFTVMAASLRTSLEQTTARTFGGDLAITSGAWGVGDLPPQLAQDVARLPDVRAAVGIGVGMATVDGSGRQVRIADPGTLAQVLDLDVRAGSLPRLGTDGVAVSRRLADDRGWRLGATVPVRFADSTTERLRIRAIYDTTDTVGDVLLPRAAWTPHARQDADSAVLVKLAPGADVGQAKAEVTGVARRWGAPTPETRAEYVATSADGVTMLLGLVYVMLALAVLIALLGIANTLALAMHERTRELGLLRAVGQTRRQLRSMVRLESLVVALLGTAGGLLLGVALGWAIVESADTIGIEAFAAPVVQLAAVLVVGGVAGLLAGLRPARRAARLDVLRAIATE